jgi:hypothetical protein
MNSSIRPWAMIEKLLDITQAAGHLIDKIFSFAGPVYPAGNGDLIVFQGQDALAVIERQADFSHPVRPAPGGS